MKIDIFGKKYYCKYIKIKQTEKIAKSIKDQHYTALDKLSIEDTKTLSKGYNIKAFLNKQSIRFNKMKTGIFEIGWKYLGLYLFSESTVLWWL